MHSRQITFSVDEGEGRNALLQLLDEFEGSEGGGRQREMLVLPK